MEPLDAGKAVNSDKCHVQDLEHIGMKKAHEGNICLAAVTVCPPSMELFNLVKTMCHIVKTAVKYLRISTVMLDFAAILMWACLLLFGDLRQIVVLCASSVPAVFWWQ